ncbi:hypothetical protein Vretimale_3160 [Volvox reticuliferus]|uniref:3'-5' exonuclease domain-containing protein n=1 Tax=Volvox reticuliferus TaxID=1737510 RepID=A0A8J4C7V5_9CHLO|nr:hypothetical protein Vretifemale_6587 [Volvox reticuliferus]GIL97495.1 hypothetical protein Vretimale_3160 [Volvox reticuliferus]
MKPNTCKIVYRMPLGAKHGSSKSRTAVLAGISAAVAATAATAVALLLEMRRRRRHVGPQMRFRSVFADTTDQPFPHQPPQPDDYDDDNITEGGGSASGDSSARCPTLQAAAMAVRTAAVADATCVASGIAAATDPTAAAPTTEGFGFSKRGASRQVRAAGLSTAPQGPLVHPYLARIQRLMGAMECLVLRRSPPPLPLPPPAGGAAVADKTHWSLPGFQIHWISNPKQLYSLGQRLRLERQVGLDTESSPLLSYHGLVCLIQLSVWDGGGDGGRNGASSNNSNGSSSGSGSEDGTVWLVDALALHDHVGPALGALMSDPRVIKVIHGGGNDVVWLQRDFRMYPVNVFDTEKASQVLGYESRALSSLLRRHVGLDMVAEKAAGQRADWRRRPLPPGLLRYAAADVAYLPYLADVLRRELAALEPERDPTPSPSNLASRKESRYVSAPLVMTQCQPLQTPLHGPPPPTPAAPLLPVFMQMEPHTAQQPDQQQETQCQQRQQDLAEGGGEAAGGGSRASATVKPTLTALGHAVIRSHQLSLTLYRKPLSDAQAAGAGNVAAVPAGTATAAAAAVMRKFFSTSPPVASGVAAAASGAAGRAVTMAEATDSVLAVCRWRDATARRLDIGPQLLLPDMAVAALVAARPPPADGRALLRLVSEQIAIANQALQAEPYAARYEICTALRSQADALSKLLAAAVAGRLPAAAAAATAAAGADGAVVGRPSRRDPGTAQEQRSWLIEKFSAKTQVYQNCRMLSREGQLLCFCDTRKLNWYLGKGLAVQVCEDPPTIQLLFEHQNTDQQTGADDFYTQSKANRCVGCGCSSHYLRYRVLPACYRRPMPAALKSHRSHDVVLLCIDCHERAQKAAEQLKRQVALDYGIPLLPPRTPLQLQHGAAGWVDRGTAAAVVVGAPAGGGGSGGDNGGVDVVCSDDVDAEGDGYGDGSGSGAGTAVDGLPGGIHPSAARRAALALQKSGAKMPLERTRRLEAIIKAALGRDPAAEDPGLRAGDLEAALLAGLGRRGRNKYFRAKQQQQDGQLEGGQAAAVAAAMVARPCDNGSDGADSHVEDRSQDPSCTLADCITTANQSATTATAGVEGNSRAFDRWLDSGHLWHGERVVKLAMQRGGEEELLQLVKRFRAAFVAAVRPQYLPPAWEVDHAAFRDFGTYSVYSRYRNRGSELHGQPGDEAGEGESTAAAGDGRRAGAGRTC